MAIEIVDLPIKNGGSFHSFLYVYQRVSHLKPTKTGFSPSLSHGSQGLAGFRLLPVVSHRLK
jgi:hypothetical protein